MQTFAGESEGLLRSLVQTPHPSDASGSAFSQGGVSPGHPIVQDSKQTFLHRSSGGIQHEAWKTIIIDVCAENRCLFLKLFFLQSHL